MYMVDLFYKLLNKFKKKKGVLYSLTYKSLKVILNISFPVLYRNKNMCISGNTEGKVIVSLTSFPARIDTVWETVYTLLNQSCKASRVILWLAIEQISSKESLPSELLELEKYGLEIRFCEDLKSHKKYYYTMKEYPESIVITADDDVFYPSDWIECLLKKHNEFPDSIVCYWAHRIKIKNSTIEPYEKWESSVGDGNEEPSSSLLPVGYGGVLYPPNSLDSRVFDKEYIKKLCITADDLWLKAMAHLNGFKAIQVNREPVRFFSVIRAQGVTLSNVNNGNGQNNIALKNILHEIPELKIFS